MTATKIDGTAIAKKIRERLHAEIVETQNTNPRFKPSLKIIQGKCAPSISWALITDN
jgi:methylenetetrahydrofolate dehydrogenase (NADP+)/methenyltetrahydrofolate cyclohydrolase/formyltetrahydrofolate synthetase